MTPEAYAVWLVAENGYTDPKVLPNGMVAAIVPLMFTHAIILCDPRFMNGYEDRWCYHTYAKAKAALEAWDGTGEPTGWHRHPATDRRRPDGDPLRERIGTTPTDEEIRQAKARHAERA